MKEIEIKLSLSSFAEAEERINKLTGKKGSEVKKDDIYFRTPSSRHQALRIRNNNGRLEATCKKMSYTETEENEEFEFALKEGEEENAVSFFLALGYEIFFEKRKRGLEWMHESVHIELFDVNDIGTFCELEALIPFDSNDSDISRTQDKIMRIVSELGYESNIERRSYRELILGPEYR